jgi:hypothetical protein
MVAREFLPDASSVMIEALDRAFELKAKGGLTEEEYNELKGNLLAGQMPRSAAARLPADGLEGLPGEGTAPMTRDALVALFAGDLHRTIVRALEGAYPREQEDSRRYMTGTVAELVAVGALNATDVPIMHRVIDIVCDLRYRTEPREGLQGLVDANLEVRLSRHTSSTAKAIVGIAEDSARNAVVLMPSQPAAAGKPQPDQSDPGRLWDTVKEDVLGAIGLTGCAAAVLAVPSVPAALLLTTLGGPAVAFPAIAILGSGLLSGIDSAKRRTPG